MDTTDLKSELKDGLAETRKYILSHHEPENHHRCYTFRIRDRPIRLCARCSGIYPGIGVGLLMYHSEAVASQHLVLIAVLPAFALADWAIVSFTRLRGLNSVRTATGLLLGVAYGLGLARVILAGEPVVIAFGIGYGGIAALLLRVHGR